MVYSLSLTCLLMDIQNVSSYVLDQKMTMWPVSHTKNLCLFVSFLGPYPEVRLVGSGGLSTLNLTR